MEIGLTPMISAASWILYARRSWMSPCSLLSGLGLFMPESSQLLPTLRATVPKKELFYLPVVSLKPDAPENFTNSSSTSSATALKPVIFRTIFRNSLAVGLRFILHFKAS